jgi:hypothetical protein
LARHWARMLHDASCVTHPGRAIAGARRRHPPTRHACVVAARAAETAHPAAGRHAPQHAEFTQAQQTSARPGRGTSPGERAMHVKRGMPTAPLPRAPSRCSRPARSSRWLVPVGLPAGGRSQRGRRLGAGPEARAGTASTRPAPQGGRRAAPAPARHRRCTPAAARVLWDAEAPVEAPTAREGAARRDRAAQLDLDEHGGGIGSPSVAPMQPADDFAQASGHGAGRHSASEMDRLCPAPVRRRCNAGCRSHPWEVLLRAHQAPRVPPDVPDGRGQHLLLHRH